MARGVTRPRKSTSVVADLLQMLCIRVMILEASMLT